MDFDPGAVPAPCYILDEAALDRNVAILEQVQRRTGARILLALKAFAMPDVFPMLRGRLCGTAASSLYEARLGYEEFGDSVHLCAPAYRDDEFDALLGYCRHVIFNSCSQWRRLRPRVERRGRDIACGIRVNPEHSEVATPLYDPCRPGSRLGVTREHFDCDALDGLTGIHFHALCGHNADALERTLAAFERRFGEFLHAMRWLNLGGGHHITRADYDVDRLCALIDGLRRRYGVEVYLEPGEAVVLDAGVLVASVLDILPNGTAILDVSATCHMPDVIEMPYRPEVTGAGPPGEYAHSYRLGGPTCLAGDEIGEYSFPAPLAIGTRIVFEDMACYTMVKNTSFNGVRLPPIAIRDAATGEIRIVREFGYEDYRDRLGKRAG